MLSKTLNLQVFYFVLEAMFSLSLIHTDAHSTINKLCQYCFSVNYDLCIVCSVLKSGQECFDAVRKQRCVIAEVFAIMSRLELYECLIMT